MAPSSDPEVTSSLPGPKEARTKFFDVLRCPLHTRSAFDERTSHNLTELSFAAESICKPFALSCTEVTSP